MVGHRINWEKFTCPWKVNIWELEVGQATVVKAPIWSLQTFLCRRMKKSNRQYMRRMLKPGVYKIWRLQ